MSGAALWPRSGNGGGGGANVATPRTPAATVGLRFLLAVVGSLFTLLSLAFLTRAQFEDWQSLAGAAWQPLSDPLQLWVNTGLLALSSAALQWARVAARRGQIEQLRTALLIGGAFAAAFLLGQLWLWQQLYAAGYYLAANPANSFFYLMTGLHGLHLLAGLLGWARCTLRAWQRADVTAVSTGVGLCATWWHFLLAVWLLLFALLVSSPETIAALAALCGLR